jgi:hypothetical protein
MGEMSIAILRKLIFIGLLLLTYLLVDRLVLPGFNTPKVISGDPKAIAVLLGLLSVAVALA